MKLGSAKLFKTILKVAVILSWLTAVILAFQSGIDFMSTLPDGFHYRIAFALGVTLALALVAAVIIDVRWIWLALNVCFGLFNIIFPELGWDALAGIFYSAPLIIIGLVVHSKLIKKSRAT